MQTLNIFLSYVSDDKKFVGEIKKCIEDKYRITVFVAHDDLIPSVEWESHILDSLKHIHLFVPVTTKRFHDSCYTNQEIGFALALEKTILPIKIDSNPQGFISKYQALTCNKDPIKIARIIYSLVLFNRQFAHLKNFAINSLIIALQSSRNFEETNILIKQLSHVYEFTNDQLIGIQRAMNENSQVGNMAWEVPKFKSQLSKKYKISFEK